MGLVILANKIFSLYATALALSASYGSSLVPSRARANSARVLTTQVMCSTTQNHVFWLRGSTLHCMSGTEIMESDYQLSGGKPSYLTRILDGLRAYTIGSCNYWSCHRCDHTIHVPKEDILLQSKIISDKPGDNDEEEEWKRMTWRADRKMKKRLSYHFKSHIEKWTDKTRRRFPWKLALHVLLLIIVTTQVSKLLSSRGLTQRRYDTLTWAHTKCTGWLKTNLRKVPLKTRYE